MKQLILALALVAAACGGSSTVPTTPAGGAPTEADSSAPQEEVSTGPSAEPSTAAADDVPTAEPPPFGQVSADTTSSVPRPRPTGPDAPPFALALAQGGEFSPAGEAKPIYMVFWAEW